MVSRWKQFMALLVSFQGGNTYVLYARHGLAQMDTLGFEPRAFRMRSGCDATTPCAPWEQRAQQSVMRRQHALEGFPKIHLIQSGKRILWQPTGARESYAGIL